MMLPVSSRLMLVYELKICYFLLIKKDISSFIPVHMPSSSSVLLSLHNMQFDALHNVVGFKSTGMERNYEGIWNTFKVV